MNVPTALINPAVDPFKYQTKYIEQYKNFHTNEIDTVTKKHARELEELYMPEKKNLPHIFDYLLSRIS